MDPKKRFDVKVGLKVNIVLKADQRTGKLTHTYIDREWQGEVVDYLGEKFPYFEKSAIHLESAPFKISMLDAFWDYMCGIKQKEIWYGRKN